LVGSTTTKVAMGAPVLVAAAAVTGSTAGGATETGTSGATGASGSMGTVTVGGVVGAGVATGGVVAKGAVVVGGRVASGNVAGGGGCVTTAASPSGLSCALDDRAFPTQLEKTTPRTDAMMAALREREVMGIEHSRSGEKGSW
jgi:hypothetical protein